MIGDDGVLVEGGLDVLQLADSVEEALLGQLLLRDVARDLEAPTILPWLSLMGEIVTETSIRAASPS